MTGSSSFHLRRSGAPERGFTLVELAVAFVIVAFLLASVAIPFSTQLELRDISDTRKQLEDIKEALIGFSMSQGRLPCPADPTVATGDANAGMELTSCSAGTTMRGVIPWATLGLRETDSWGRRFTYRVTALFTDVLPGGAATHGCSTAPNPLPTLSSFALCSPGDMTVNTKNTSTKVMSIIANQVAAVVISHGKNGFGASQPTAVYVHAAPASHVDEITNGAAATTAFISRDHSSDTNTCSDTAANTPFCEFDDIVTWISPSTLVARMVSAGRLP